MALTRNRAMELCDSARAVASRVERSMSTVLPVLESAPWSVSPLPLVALVRVMPAWAAWSASRVVAAVKICRSLAFEDPAATVWIRVSLRLVIRVFWRGLSAWYGALGVRSEDGLKRRLAERSRMKP